MKSRLQFAFTLIELIVVIAVILVFIGVFASNFYNQAEEKKLRGALAHLRSFIDLTRHNSLNLLIPSACALANFEGYGINRSGNILTQTYYCPTANDTTNTYDISTYDHIEFFSITPTTFYFYKRTGESLTGALKTKTDVTIILRNVVTNQCSQLLISQFGIFTTDESIDCP